MIKFLLGVAIVAFTSFCGYFLAKKYRQRKLFFLQLREFNERFLNEISYYRRPVREFIATYSYRGEFNVLLSEFFSSVENNRPPDLSCVSELSFLKQEEQRGIEDYFFMLGKGDSASQKGYFTAAKDTLLKWQTEADAANKKLGDLYVKLGFLCGLLILILMI